MKMDFAGLLLLGEIFHHLRKKREKWSLCGMAVGRWHIECKDMRMLSCQLMVEEVGARN